jgi:hypothetical protein
MVGLAVRQACFAARRRRTDARRPSRARRIRVYMVGAGTRSNSAITSTGTFNTTYA